jgi:hypothetical protein
MGANTTATFTDYVMHLIAEEHGGQNIGCVILVKVHWRLALMSTMSVCITRAQDTDIEAIMDSRHF